MPTSPHDPLADLRAPEDPPLDVLIAGTVFLDIIFTGVQELPRDGQEVYAAGMGSCPGGIANLAVATQRLGLRTSLAAAFGDDSYGDFCWSTLADGESVDLSRSRRFDRWHSPVTVSLASRHDRSMVTHAHPPPVNADEMIGTPPRSRAVITDLAPDTRVIGNDDNPTWVDLARKQGALVFADVGWDPSGRWPSSVLDQVRLCDAFMPNAAEAMAYTRTDTVNDALYALADLVPLAVVTNGASGAQAIDASTGEEASVPALRVEALDTTGAGDVFGAAIVLGSLAGWPLSERLAFASLCSSLAVQQFGGSLAAPAWGDIADWWAQLRASPRNDAYHRALRRRYAFLAEHLSGLPSLTCRRASATIARLADLEGLER